MARADATHRRLMTVAEASDVLRQSEASVYRHVRLGHLEALRVGDTGPLRFTPEAIEALLRPARPEPRRER